MEPLGRLLNQSKTTPLEGADEKSGHNSIIIYHIVSLRPKVIDMLIW